MTFRRRDSVMVLCISLMAAFILTVTPLPEWLRLLRPNLVLLATMYWLVRLPEGVGVGGACVMGLIYDGVIGSPLGLHAFSFSLIATILLLLYARWRMFIPLQQAVGVFALLMLDQMVGAWAQGTLYRTELHGWVWVSSLLGAALWPFLNHAVWSQA